jgi:hypothetical protein
LDLWSPGFSFTALISGLICGETCKLSSRHVRATIMVLNVCPLVGNALYFLGINCWYIIGGRFVAGERHCSRNFLGQSWVEWLNQNDNISWVMLSLSGGQFLWMSVFAYV